MCDDLSKIEKGYDVFGGSQEKGVFLSNRSKSGLNLGHSGNLIINDLAQIKQVLRETRCHSLYSNQHIHQLPRYLGTKSNLDLPLSK